MKKNPSPVVSIQCQRGLPITRRSHLINKKMASHSPPTGLTSQGEKSVYFKIVSFATDCQITPNADWGVNNSYSTNGPTHNFRLHSISQKKTTPPARPQATDLVRLHQAPLADGPPPCSSPNNASGHPTATGVSDIFWSPGFSDQGAPGCLGAEGVTGI